MSNYTSKRGFDRSEDWYDSTKKITTPEISTMESVSPEMRRTEPITVKGKIVNASLVNMRKTPAKIDNVIMTLQKGKEVTIIDELPNYYKIQVGDEIGYVASNFCERIR